MIIAHCVEIFSVRLVFSQWEVTSPFASRAVDNSTVPERML
jgi:hypothetical protein